MRIFVNNNTLFSLSFVDDQVLLAQDSYDLEFMMKKLHQEYKKWGLEMSLAKRKYLVINSDARFQVLINDNVEIKQVEKFKYLGSYLDKNVLGELEIKYRLGVKLWIGSVALNEDLKRKLLAIKMDYIRRSARILILERKPIKK